MKIPKSLRNNKAILLLRKIKVSGIAAVLRIKPRHFLFKGEKLAYCNHHYNATYENERTLEIPIAKKYLSEEKGRILEIGNVLVNYVNRPHDVVDKYEKGKGIMNKDVVNFKINKKYDLILSISTMEHVGYDEKKKDSKKIIRSVENLKKYLKKNGKIFITVPIGYNPYLDEILLKNKINWSEQYFYKKIKHSTITGTVWKKVKKIYPATYNKPLNGTNLLFVGIING